MIATKEQEELSLRVVAMRMGVPYQVLKDMHEHIKKCVKNLSASETADLERQFQILKSQFKNPAMQEKSLHNLCPNKMLVAYILGTEGKEEELFEALQSIRG